MKPEPSEENPRLLLAGEHTHPTYWSFMHGARLSGNIIGLTYIRNPRSLLAKERPH